MSLTEEQITALLAEAAGGPVARMFPTFDPRTGRLRYPVWRPVLTKYAPAQRRKRKASRKQAQASRKKNRRKRK